MTESRQTSTASPGPRSTGEEPPSPDHRCQVWTLQLAAATEDRQAFRSLLSADERVRADRFRFDRDREAYEAAHALVRLALSRRQPSVAPEDWTFAATPRGRPEIAGGEADCRLRFNLSHTHGLVACVVSRELDCGIDVEHIGRDLRLEDLEDPVLAPPEREDLHRLPRPERPAHFLRYWTAKEAYAKARGLGLALPVRQVAIDLNGPHPRLAGDATREGPLEAWHFRQWRPAERYWAAVAVRAEGPAAPPIEIRDWYDGGIPDGENEAV